MILDSHLTGTPTLLVFTDRGLVNSGCSFHFARMRIAQADEKGEGGVPGDAPLLFSRSRNVISNNVLSICA